jgi:hypothetical protein
MSRFSDWFNQKYAIWEKAQGSPQTYMSYAAYLTIDPNVVINLMLDKAQPDEGDLMAVAVKEGMEVYDLVGMEQPESGIVEVFLSLGSMPTHLRLRMAKAIHEADIIVKGQGIPAGSKESIQVYSESLKRWGFRYQAGKKSFK